MNGAAASAMPPDLAAAVGLGGEVGRLFAEFDWATHPLGAPAGWSAGLRAAVALTLTSRFPIVLWIGADDKFVLYNDAYIQILGDKHPAALGRPGQQVWWDIWEPISPMLASVFATGEATWSDDLMLPIVTAGRRSERYFTFTYSPLIGDDGDVYGIFCAVTETTERVLSERRLRALNAVTAATVGTRTIEDAVTVAVAACAGEAADLPFVAVYLGGGTDITLSGATPAVLPALPPTLAELIEIPEPGSWHEFQIIDDIASVVGDLDTALGEDRPRQAVVLPLVDGDGALLIGINPRCPLDEQYRGFCQLLAAQLSSAMRSAVSYDQERQRGDALAEIDRAKTAFLANVSHEFRTPLTLLIGPLDDALADAGQDRLLAHRLRTAQRSAGRLRRLVDSLLDFSRIEAGRAAPELVCVDVGDLTSNIASSFTELCARAGLEFTVNCDDSLLADLDPAMWETILLNLLSNAVKYTTAGSITVRVEGESEQCRITVRDTGIGVDADDLDRLGERFFRAGNARARSVEGSGIGLALVRGLVELHHGTLRFDSEAGHGTCVTIELPRSAAQVPVERPSSTSPDNPYVIEAGQWLEPPEMPAEPAGDDGRELVLIVDDNPDMRAHLQRILSPRWRTALAAEGEAALENTRRLRPDAIVTDIMMPRLDGFDFIAAVRADPELAGTPVLMLSARAGAEAISEGYAGGADDYFPKPFRSQELVERVAARIAAARREHVSRQQREVEIQQESVVAQLESELQAAESADGILAVLWDFLADSIGVAAIAVGLLDTDRNIVRFHYAGAVPAELRDRYHTVSLDAPLVPIEVIKSGEPMVISDTLDLAERFSHIVNETADRVRACVSQPLRGQTGQVIGSLGLLWAAPREFDPGELDGFAWTARITQSALDRVRLAQREHRIAVDFQDSLLALDDGSTAAAVAAAYRPAGETMRVGGDWYLVVPLDRPHRVAISVGDVVGHGLPAAIVMSQLRAAIAAAALTDPEPGAVLEVLDRYAATVPGARCATVSYAVFDDTTGALAYSCAGHPYPLLIAPAGPRLLESGRHPPLAVTEHQGSEPAARCDIPPGGAVLLYTDGLIEWPGQTLDQGFARLLDVAADCAELSVGEICAELLDRMEPPDGYTDDVVVLVLRPCHAGARSFTTVVPATFDEIRTARHRLRDWLVDVGVESDRSADILLAIGEAVTNAVEHGSDLDPRRSVSVEAFLDSEAVAATVSDSGHWTVDSSASRRSDQRGRGLTMINALADHVDTIRTTHGTRVTLRFDNVAVASGV